jgi:cytochrome c556
MKKLGLALVIAPYIFAVAGLAAGATEVVKARHDNFHKLGGDFKAISEQLKADKPDLAVIQAKAADAKALAGTMNSWFPAGSGPESGEKTEAKAEIWSDAAGFAAKREAFQTESAKLQQVAAADNLEAIKMQFKATGESCKACHSSYRAR